MTAGRLAAFRQWGIIAKLCAGLSLIIGAGGMSTASAQTQVGGAASAPDKSSFTLFDPTPVDQMRSFCTDRPPRANLACTVDAGHFQYESDMFNWSYARTG